MRIIAHRSKNTHAVVLLLLAVLLAGCTIPRQEFAAYRQASEQAADATIGWWLQAKIDARQVAEHPGNPKSIDARLRDLQNRLADADDRHLALEAVRRYDAALLALTEGHDPQTVQTNVDALITGLQRVPIDRFADIVADIMPYGSVISGAINLMDEQIRARIFRRAVSAADTAIGKIIAILDKDARSLTKIRVELIELQRDKLIEQAAFARESLVNLAGTANGWATLHTGNHRQRADRVLSKIPRVPDLSSLQEPNQAGVVDHSLAAIYQQATAQLVELSERNRALDQTIAAQHDATTAYSKMLVAWREAHAVMHDEAQQIYPLAALELARRALDLREAWMRVGQTAQSAP